MSAQHLRLATIFLLKFVGKRTEDSVLCEFLETFEAHHNLKTGETGDSRVTLEKFLEYYSNISSSIDDDDYFELVINNAWNIKSDSAISRITRGARSTRISHRFWDCTCT